MRFGNFTNLAYMQSSPTDVYANSPTFSFYGSSYSSKYISFQGFELEDRNQATLMNLPSNYTGPFQQYGSSYPFINVANKFVMEGSFYFPDQLDGKNWTQIIQLLSSSNVLSNELYTSANAITAAICKVTPNSPSSVCGNPSVSTLSSALAAYRVPTGGASTAGSQLANASQWVAPQSSGDWVAAGTPHRLS